MTALIENNSRTGYEPLSGYDPLRESVEAACIRSADVIDREALNQYTPHIVGCGAIGSQVALMLAKMGLETIVLYDFDAVSIENVGVQGFALDDIGSFKTAATARNIRKHNQLIDIYTMNEEVCGITKDIYKKPVVFACVDSMRARKKLFNDFIKNKAKVFFDTRMAAESLRCFTVLKNRNSIENYKKYMFTDAEIPSDSCTAKSTIYCASIAAGLIVYMFKVFSTKEILKENIYFSIPTFDIF